MLAILENKTARPGLRVGQEYCAHAVDDSTIELNQSPEMRVVTQPMWNTVPTASEDSNATGNNFTGLFR